jgi:hypothetical protein
MLLIKGQGYMRVALSDIARVEIAGSAESLSLLADWFVFAADSDNWTHQHYQYVAGQGFPIKTAS